MLLAFLTDPGNKVSGGCGPRIFATRMTHDVVRRHDEGLIDSSVSKTFLRW
jgi:hypothetical protein